MAKSKVDTKALESLEDTQTIDNSASGDRKEAIALAVDSLETIGALFGTSDYQLEAIMRDFCYTSSRRMDMKAQQVTSTIADIVTAEENSDQFKVERLSRIRDAQEAEERDAGDFHEAALRAFERMIGKAYEPLPAKKPIQRKAESPMQRLARLKGAA